MKLSHQDELLLQRYRDGELPAADAADFRRRLADEPALRAAHDALSTTSGLFRTGAETVFAAPAGFAAAVLAETRRLPDRIALREAETAARAMVLCRRLLLAALVLLGLGLAWHAGLFPRAGNDVLTAAPGDADREMDRLDAIIQSWNVGTGASPKERGHR